MSTGVLFDVDGTLVDTNYLHVIAWWQAFRSQGHDVPMTRLHRTVGQGSDQFVSSILDHDDDKVADAHSDFYGQWKHQLVAFPGAAVWDVQAAGRAGVPCVCVLTGGISESELREAGAIAVYRDVAHLAAEFDDSPLGKLAR